MRFQLHGFLEPGDVWSVLCPDHGISVGSIMAPSGGATENFGQCPDSNAQAVPLTRSRRSDLFFPAAIMVVTFLHSLSLNTVSVAQITHSIKLSLDTSGQIRQTLRLMECNEYW